MPMRPQFQRLVDKIRMRPPLAAAIVHPCDSDSLQLALSGAFAGYLAPVLVSPESRIRDANIAQESAQMTKFNILTQSGIAALSQANQSSQSVLSLLR